MNLHLWTGADPQDLKKVAKGPLQRTQVPYKLTSYLAPIEGEDGAIVVPLPQAQPGDVVLGMGLKCVKSFQALGLMPKNKGLGKLRETPIDLGNDVQGLVTYDPGIIHQDWARIPEIQWDINLAARMVQTGSMEAKLGFYTWTQTFAPLIKEILKKFEETGKPVPVSCDLETMGLDPFALDKFILTIGFFVFVFATLSAMQRFGSLIGATVVMALLVDLIFGPALVRTFYKDRHKHPRASPPGEEDAAAVEAADAVEATSRRRK